MNDRRRSLAGRELRVEVAFAGLFVLAAAALLMLLPSEQELSVPTAVALTLLYALASRVEFESGIASTVPTQLVFVPMLFLLPTAAVPLFVAAGLLLGRLPRYLTGYTPVNRAVVELGDALYSIGPVAGARAGGSRDARVRRLAGLPACAWRAVRRRHLDLEPPPLARARHTAAARGCASWPGSASPTRCCHASAC